MEFESISLKKRIHIIKKHKRVFFYINFFAFILVTIYNIFSTRLYKAETTIIPVESNRGDMFSAFQGQNIVGALSGLMSGITPSADKLINILESKTINETIITKLDLMPLLFQEEWDKKSNNWKNPYDQPLMEDAVKKLEDDVLSVNNTKRGLIEIGVVFSDPYTATEIANEYINELQNFINTNSLSMGKRNRIFLEGQLEKTRNELANAEEELQFFQTKNKLISMESHAEITVKTVSNLKAEIVSREYQLGLLKNTTGLNTAEARRLLDEKLELEKQLAKLETGSNLKQNKSKNLSTLKDLSSLEVEYFRLKRNSLILEKVFELLTTQYEIAKIEEVRDQIAFQVIDKARVPEKKFKPKVILNTIIALFASLLLSAFGISSFEVIKKELWS